MDWNEVGAIGQVLGSVAVFVTLGYLSVQVRHARDEVRRNVRRSRVTDSRDLFVTTAIHPQLASVIQRMEVEIGSPPLPFRQYAVQSGLNEVEARQAWSFMYALWHNFEATIISIDYLSPGIKHDLNHRLRSNYTGSRIGAKWYELTKAQLNPDAVCYVDTLLAQSG